MTKKQKKNLYRIIISAFLLVAALLIPSDGWLRLILFFLPYAVISYDILWSAAQNIINGQVFDENFLMAIASLGAFCVAEYAEAAGVMLFYQVGELFEKLAVGKSRKSIASLMDIRPDHANLFENGRERQVSPENVSIGDVIVIRPGERVPLDGVIIEGSTSVDTAALTGESVPRDYGVGNRIVSGSINLSSVIKVEVSSVYGDSVVSRILDLVENSASRKAKSENFITRFARYYTPCVVLAALLLAVLPPLIFQKNWSEWIYRALTFLVVSCPCALVVSIPLSFFGGIGGASRRGILIKGSNYLETLSKADTLVFDKTGTLTQGSFSVTGIFPERISQSELLELAALAESHSTHPIALSILKTQGDIDNSHKRIGEVSELPGLGVKAVIDDREIFLGNRKLMEQVGVSFKDANDLGSVVFISTQDEYLGRIVISDELKPDSAAAISSLKKLGISKTVMLTGDTDIAGQAIGKKLGIDEIHTQLMPEDKVTLVEKLLNEVTGSLAFVGDGINDAPVLSRADVGIAMGAMGSDAAIEAADIVLMDDKPSKLVEALAISRKTMSIVRENIIFALSVKGLVLLLTGIGAVGMWAAVFADVGVMILAILNAIRALSYPTSQRSSK